MHTPSGRHQLAIEPAPETSEAIKQTADEECHLLNLPVELRKMILEYVGGPIPTFHFALEGLRANHSTADLKRGKEERMSYLQAVSAPCHASVVSLHVPSRYVADRTLQRDS